MVADSYRGLILPYPSRAFVDSSTFAAFVLASYLPFVDLITFVDLKAFVVEHLILAVHLVVHLVVKEVVVVVVFEVVKVGVVVVVVAVKDYLVEDLIGMTINDEEGAIIGQIVGVTDYGFDDILIVKQDEILYEVPFRKAIFKSEGKNLIAIRKEFDGAKVTQE